MKNRTTNTSRRPCPAFLVLLFLASSTALIITSVDAALHRFSLTYMAAKRARQRPSFDRFASIQSASDRLVADSQSGLKLPSLAAAVSKLRGGQNTVVQDSSLTDQSTSVNFPDLTVFATAIATVTMAARSLSATIAQALRDGPHITGVASLALISVCTVVPLTLFRRAYAFSVGYAFSIAAMGSALMRSFDVPALPSSSASLSSPAHHLARIAALYGFRLAAFLLLREATVEGKADATRAFDDASEPRHKRLPLALSVSVFYALLVSPVLYVLRSASDDVTVRGGAGSCLEWAGAGLAYGGFVLEAVADQHKFAVKRRHKVAYARDPKRREFVGPTGGTYGLCRHPNYFGHVLFWTGLLMGGVPSFGKDAVAWVCGALGWYGIYFVMTSATKRLEGKQQDVYGGQERFEEWRGRVKGKLAPSFIN